VHTSCRVSIGEGAPQISEAEVQLTAYLWAYHMRPERWKRSGRPTDLTAIGAYGAAYAALGQRWAAATLTETVIGEFSLDAEV
jgi:hypothetical protein